MQALLAQEVNRGRIPTAAKIGNQQIPHRGNLNADRIFIAFNLIVPLLLESKEISDMNRMIGAMVSAMICSELGARIGKWLDVREQAKELAKEPE